MCCSKKCAKVFFGIVNVIVGVSFIIVYTNALEDDLIFTNAFWIPNIVIGCLLILLGLVTIFGACTERAYLGLYAPYIIGVIQILILAVGLSGLAAVHLMEDKITDSWSQKMYETMLRYSLNDTDAQNDINYWQQYWGCCGVNGYEDWARFYPNSIPRSCYGNTQGCVDIMMDGLINAVNGASISLAVDTVIQILMLIFMYWQPSSVKCCKWEIDLPDCLEECDFEITSCSC